MSDEIEPTRPINLEDPAGVLRHVRSLPRHHQVRTAVQKLKAGEEPTVDELEECINVLIPPVQKSWKLKSVAAWALSRSTLDPAMEDKAVDRLTAIVESRPGHSKGCMESAACLTGCYIGIPYILYAFYRDAPIHRVRLAALEALGEMESEAAWQTLATAATRVEDQAYTEESKVRRMAALGLAKVLPKLPDRGFRTVSGDVAKSVIQMLRAAPQRDFPTLLGVIEAVGHPHELTAFKRSRKWVKTPEGKAAYDSALAVLEERNRKAIEAGTLLRPVDSMEDSSVLLRPAQGVSEVESATLLRPTEEPENLENRG